MGPIAEQRRSSRLMTPKTPRFWPEMKTRGNVGAASVVDTGTLDRAARECLAGQCRPARCDRCTGCRASRWCAARTRHRKLGALTRIYGPRPRCKRNQRKDEASHGQRRPASLARAYGLSVRARREGTGLSHLKIGVLRVTTQKDR